MHKQYWQRKTLTLPHWSAVVTYVTVWIDVWPKQENNMKRHWGSLVRYVITFCVQLFYIFVHCPWAFSYSLNDLALLTIAIYHLLLLTDFKSSTLQFQKGTVSDRQHAKHEIFVLNKKILPWRTGSVWPIELESLF